MEAFNHTPPSVEESLTRSVELIPAKMDMSYLRCEQKEIVTNTLTSPDFITRFTQYDNTIYYPDVQPPSLESIVFEELCFAELSHTKHDNQTYLSPSESSAVLKTIAKELKIPRPPINSDGLLIEHDGRNSYLTKVCEYTLTNNLSEHKTAQMDRYLNKNKEMDFLSTPESLTVFNRFLRQNRENFPSDLIVDISEIKPLLVLSYFATPNRTFHGVEVSYSTFPAAVVQKITQSVRHELQNKE